MQCRANPFRTLNLNGSSVFLNNLVRDGQAQTGSFIERTRVLSCKEWVEDMVKVLRRDSMPCIFDFNMGPLLPIRFPDLMSSHTDRTRILSYGIHRIQKQIEHDLFDLLPI